METPGQTPKTDAEAIKMVEAAITAPPVEAPKTPEPKQEPTDGTASTEEGALALVNRVLKREFTSVDEAEKTLTNMNSMVGDNAIADLRAKAGDADKFKAVVGAYAKAEGITPEAAAEALMKEVGTAIPQATVPTSSTDAPKGDFVSKDEFGKMKLRLEERDLLEAHPDAKHVIEEIKSLSVGQGKSLTELYAGSNLKTIAEKASKLDKESEEKETTGVESNSRTLNTDEVKVQGLVGNIQKMGLAGDKEALVKEVLGL